MPTRLMHSPAKPKIQAPQTHAEWHKLMMSAIDRATTTKSRLAVGLRDALAKGQTEPFLRKLGIIHPNDLERLFPQR
jgi:hypothetical protein